MSYLIALTLNLAGMLLIYSLMAFGLVRLSWKQRGITPVLIMIIISGFFWSVPTILVFLQDAKSADPVSYSLWLGNWLVSGFSVIILCQTLKGIPRQLEDSARLDGCGRFAIYWHVLLPLIKRELGLIAFLTLVATSGLCWAALTMRGGGLGFSPPWMRWLSTPPSDSGPNPSLGLLVIGEFIAGCIVVSLPVMLIFLFSKRYLLRPARFEDK